MLSVKKINFSGNLAANLQKFQTLNYSQNTQDKNYVSTGPQSPPQNNDKNLKLAKTTAFVGSALALASLCAVGVIHRKNLSAGKALKELGTKFNDVKDTLSKSQQEIKDLGKWHDGIIDGVEKSIRNDFDKKISGIKQAVTETTDNFFSKIINVNGKDMKVATVFNDVSGEAEAKMVSELKGEAGKRILGAVKRNENTPEELIVRMPTSEIRPFSNTGGMSIVPKELISNLAGMINTKQKATLYLDTPLYTGNIANNTYYTKEANLNKEGIFDGTYKYVKTFLDKNDNQMKKEVMTKLTEVDKLNLSIYTEKAIQKEDVTVYVSENLTSLIDYNHLKPRLTKEVQSEVENALSSGKVFESDLIKVVKDQKTGLPKAYAKYKTVFYDSPKFNMNGRVNKNENINIYRNDSIVAGETERMVYFSKFFSEQVMNSETAKVPLRADLIIGNDWQTGPISAMIRQLTTVRKYFGMEPEKAERIHNTPIITLFHNAGLSGSAWHSQEKLLNVMFGEHTARIVESAAMPDTRIAGKGGLPSSLWNALMNQHEVNPQLMAANYSDILIPVSEKYGNEMATHSGFGGAGHDIFKIRARKFEFGDLSNLKFIAKNNGYNEDLVTLKPTLKGIGNGCDAMNNILTEKGARIIEEAVGLKLNSLRELKHGEDVAKWHRENKKVYLDKVVEEINIARNSNGKTNTMNIELPEMTDLTGVTENTPVYSTAGRIVDQKGLDIFAQSIKDFYTHFKGTNYPVFYAQGVGDEVYIQQLLKVKNELAQTNPEAAKRIVFARLFSEPGRYDGCKIMSDFTVMSSWFEPCGLVHKEIAKYSGSIPIVLDVGGLTAGLTDGVNAIFAAYKHRFDNYSEALNFNAKSFSGGLQRAYEWFNDKEKFAKGVKASQELDHSWLVPNGPMDEYGKILVDLKVLKPEVLTMAA